MNAPSALAKQAIQELAANYSDALNRRDWQAFRSCWLWEATYKIQGPTPIEKKGFEANPSHSVHPAIFQGMAGRKSKARPRPFSLGSAFSQPL